MRSFCVLLKYQRNVLQAIVDKAPVVASAVLVSALHLLGANAEIVKRWTNEIQEAVNSKSIMVQVREGFRSAARVSCLPGCALAGLWKCF